MTQYINRFAGAHAYLSNFYACSVPHDGVAWPSAEHAYMAGKSDDPAYRIELLACATPSQAKRLGRRVQLRQDWEQLKYHHMMSVVRAKFAFNIELARLLVGTSGFVLVEGNTWGDRVWGVYNGEGQNALGIILMHVRVELINRGIQ